MPRVTAREVDMHPFAYSLLRQASLAPALDDIPAGGFGEVLTAEETARLLKLATQTLARWRVEGTGPKFVRLGNRIFYRSADIENFLSTRIFSSTAEADRAAA
jgi:hypothetical protein